MVHVVVLHLLRSLIDYNKTNIAILLTSNLACLEVSVSAFLGLVKKRSLLRSLNRVIHGIIFVVSFFLLFLSRGLTVSQVLVLRRINLLLLFVCVLSKPLDGILLDESCGE